MRMSKSSHGSVLSITISNVSTGRDAKGHRIHDSIQSALAKISESMVKTNLSYNPSTWKDWCHQIESGIAIAFLYMKAKLIKKKKKKSTIKTVKKDYQSSTSSNIIRARKQCPSYRSYKPRQF